MLKLLTRVRQLAHLTASSSSQPRWTDCEAGTNFDERSASEAGIRRAVFSMPDRSLSQSLTARFVIEAPLTLNPTELAGWHERGVRGVRFLIGGQYKPDFETILRYADEIARFDWHVEFDILPGDGPLLAGAEWALMRFPVAICFNRFGCFDPRRGLRHPDIELLLSLLDTGRVWLKLSDAATISSQPSPWADLSPIVHAALAIRKDRVVWGSGTDRSANPVHIADALNALMHWIPDAEERDRVLIANPARLYGFETTR